VLSGQFSQVVLKQGASGAVLARGGERHRLPAPQVEVVDTTGAGDAFNAGFVHAWLKGHDPRSCLRAAVEAGSLSVQAAGGATALMRPAAPPIV
jgi:sugar/nucleoside kinase (ribokinase family)